MATWYLLSVWLPASIGLVGYGWWTLLPRKAVKVARHRAAGRVSWRAERRMRVQNERSRGNKVDFAALMRSVQAHAVVVPMDDDTVVLVPPWNQPTQYMYVPDFDSTVTYGPGAKDYADGRLSTRTLDEEARRLIEPVFTRTEMQFADYDEVRMKEWREEFADA